MPTKVHFAWWSAKFLALSMVLRIIIASRKFSTRKLKQMARQPRNVHEYPAAREKEKERVKNAGLFEPGKSLTLLQVQQQLVLLFHPSQNPKQTYLKEE